MLLLSSAATTIGRYQFNSISRISCIKFFSTKTSQHSTHGETIEVNQKTYPADQWTNITPKISGYINRGLHLQKDHPLSIVRQQIVNYFYKQFVNNRGNAVFSVFDNLSPVVTVQQNFDNLLIPKDHPSRAKSDCYYVNQEHLLRAHTTAHQVCLCCVRSINQIQLIT